MLYTITMYGSTLRITGVNKSIQINVRERLKEFSGNTPLTTYQDAIIKTQIQQAMMPYGYFKSSITLKRSQKIIHIHIAPGRPILITDIHLRFSGEGRHTLTTTPNALNLHKGSPLNTIDYEYAKETLLSNAMSAGFLKARLIQSEIRLNAAQYTAEISLWLDTGKRFYFGQTHFSPNSLYPSLLHRYQPFQTDEPFSTESIQRFNDALSSSGYFSDVKITPQIQNSQIVPIQVDLKPAKRINYSLGIGYGTDTGPRGLISTHVTPVNSKGHIFQATAVGSLTQNIASAQYSIPAQNPLTDKHFFTAQGSTQNVNAGYSNSVLLSYAEQHKLTQFERTLSINALYERYIYNQQISREKKILVYPKLLLVFQKKQGTLFSPTGYNLNLSTFAAHQGLLSDISMAQILADLRTAITLEPLRTRIYTHFIQGATAVDNVQNVPLSLALLLGGADNLKAWSYNALGPGKYLSFANIEIQKEFKDKWYLTSGFDIGRVESGIVRRDISLGLMWVSPIGPIKAGLAQVVGDGTHSPGLHPKLYIQIGSDL